MRLQWALIAMVIGTPAMAQPQREIARELLRTFRTVVVPSAQQLKINCRSDAHLYACIAFERQQLFASCESDAAGWRMRARFDLAPVAYLWRVDWLQHELVHVEDIARSLAAYRTEIESERYPTLVDCERSAAAKDGMFRQVFSTFVIDSNRLRHPEMFAEARRH